MTGNEWTVFTVAQFVILCVEFFIFRNVTIMAQFQNGKPIMNNLIYLLIIRIDSVEKRKSLWYLFWNFKGNTVRLHQLSLGELPLMFNFFTSVYILYCDQSNADEVEDSQEMNVEN